MAVGAQPKPQSQSQPQQPPQHQPEPSPKDEALKRNTDCVYFLASLVSCKKGNSRGSLVNMDGEVIGVNIMKVLAADGLSLMYLWVGGYQDVVYQKE